MGNICIGREVVICLYVYITVAEIRVRSPKNEHISEVGLGFGVASDATRGVAGPLLLGPLRRLT